MLDVAIVGAGIFGQVVAAHLRRTGRSVMIVDDVRPGAGSPPAGCVIRPSWLTSKMSRAEIDAALALLDQLYGLRDVEFHLSPAPGKVKCHRVEPGAILDVQETLNGKVNKVGPNGFLIDEDSPDITIEIQARHVVVATGVWARELCPWAPEIQPRWGWSFRGPPVTMPKIHLWAPYKQVVSFNMDDGRSWLGDGSALAKPSEERRQASERRVRLHGRIDASEALEPRLGARPMLPGLTRPAYLERGPDGVWCLTGGGKNGTAAAAWAALELERRLT